jgi:hypothetical protein
MPAKLTEDTSLTQAKNFLSSFTGNSYYFFFGRAQGWDDEANPPTPTDTIIEEAQTHAQMISLKKLETSNACHVIERLNWVSGEYYDMYRDDWDGTIRGYSANGDTTFPKSLTDTRSIVTVDTGSGVFNVYKCIDNRQQLSGDGVIAGTVVASTVKPTSTSNEIVITSDGYRWKYLYTVSEIEKLNFFTPNFTPIRNIENNVAAGGDGAIHSIIITNPGSGYTAQPTVTFICDGTAPVVDQIIITNGSISHIKLNTAGSGNSFCNIVISAPGGSGVNANAKAIISPFGGHGFNNVDETYADKIIVTSTLSDSDPYNAVGYRQIGIIRNIQNFDGGAISIAPRRDSREKFEYVISDGDGTIINGSPLKKDGETEVIRYPSQFTQDDTDNGVQLVSVLNGGENFTTPPTVSFSGGGGTGAAATAFIVDGEVSKIIITNPGSGYTSAPSVTLTGGDGTGASAQSTIGPRTFVFLTTDYNKKHIAVENQDVISNISETLKLRLMNKVESEVKYRSGKIVFVENRDILVRTPTTLERFKMILDF